MARRVCPGRIIATVLILLMLAPIEGCVYLVIGTAAAVGGYAVSPDTIQGETEKSFSEVWDAALEIAGIMGKVDAQNDKLGEISGIINNTKVRIEIIQMTPSLVRIRIKSRRAFFPSIATAQDIYVKIMRRLGEEI